VLAESYGYRPFVLVQAGSDGRLLAGLPVMEVRGRLAALPFTDHCPPVISPAGDLTQFTLGLQQWRGATAQPGVVIHDELPAATPGIQHRPRGVRHVLPLSQGWQKTFAGLDGKVRSSIRKAQRDGVQARISQSLDDFAPFYRLHVQTRHRLGVPVQPRRFMQSVFRDIVGPGLGFVVFVSVAERPIAAAVFLAWNRHLIYKYSASDPRYWTLRPNHLVLWTAIKWGCQHGYRLFDLGRTDPDNPGLRGFKSQWGGTELPLAYSYLGVTPPGSAPKLVRLAAAKLIQSAPPLVCRAIGELLYGRAATSLA
jgi:CelD/BcsL family acetyltransferase involved in cellulose biosynthesis